MKGGGDMEDVKPAMPSGDGAGFRKPPGFVQHWVNWQVRRSWGGGRLSAAARARTPRFPFATYDYRHGTSLELSAKSAGERRRGP